MRVALLAANARRGDAIGRQIAAKVHALQTQDCEVRLFVAEGQRLHDDLADLATAHTATTLWQSAPDRTYLTQADWCFVEFGGAFDLLRLLPRLVKSKPRILFSYYGLTPPALWEPEDRARLEAAHAMCGHVWYADHALVNSRFAAEELSRKTGYPQQRIHLMTCQINPPAATPHVPDVRQKIGARDAFVLLFVGRMAVNKRPGMLIDAAARLRDLGRPVHVVYVGPQQDVYARETERCRQLAQGLGIADRVHFQGAVPEATLWGWYRSADALVLPSVHEGFGMPVIEAMACGLPVVAAGAAALPETVSSAGLIFAPDDTADLERQLRRLLRPAAPLTTTAPSKSKIALAVPRYGANFAGGAEASLRQMALTLHGQGHPVEVFTTCNQRDSRWANTLPTGTTREDGIAVHRFPIDAYDLDQHLHSCETIRHRNGDVSAEMEKLFLDHSLNSTALVDAVVQRRGEFAAVLTGPYLFGLSARLVDSLREQVLLAPCFHDEPTAHLRVFREMCRYVGGLLYHSDAEQRLAECRLGIQHPNSQVVGTLLQPKTLGDAVGGKARYGPRYLAYCGRYCPEKGLPELLDYHDRYQREYPNRFRLVCMGQGAMRLPRSPHVLDLGFVSDEVKNNVLAGADALALLSPNESLSIVVLEAWLQGTPVLVTSRCEVLVDQVERSGGGIACGDYKQFRAALNRLWQVPELGPGLGKAGKAYAVQNYADPHDYANRLLRVLRQQSMPVRELLRANGLMRAERFLPQAWQPSFMQLIKKLGVEARRRVRRSARVEFVLGEQTVGVQQQLLVSLRLTNTGDLPWCGMQADAGGLWHCLLDDKGKAIGRPRRVRLPEDLLPGQTLPMALRITAPDTPGEYRLHVCWGSKRAMHLDRAKDAGCMKLSVGQDAPRNKAATENSFLQAAQAALHRAHERKQLPTEYVDVTEGTLAPLKKLLKRKLLHNFRKAYVDVLSRQQSEVNEALVTALCQLLDGCNILSRQVAQQEKELRRLHQVNRRLQRQLALQTPVEHSQTKDVHPCDAS